MPVPAGMPGSRSADTASSAGVPHARPAVGKAEGKARRGGLARMGRTGPRAEQTCQQPRLAQVPRPSMRMVEQEKVNMK